MHKKRSLWLISLAFLLLLAIVPVTLTAGYLIGNTRRQLEHTARQTVDYYISQFATRSESILKSLRGNIYILTTDKALQTALESSDADSLSSGAEGDAGRIITGAGWQDDSVTGIFVFKDADEYVSVLRGGIYSGGTSRAVSVYREFGDTNSARNLRVSASSPDFCYLITDYLNLATMQPLGKIIIEIDAEVFVSGQYLQGVYGGAAPVLSDLDGNMLYGGEASPLLAQAATAGALPSGSFVEVEGQSYYHSAHRLGSDNLKIDVFVPETEIFSGINSTVRLYSFILVGVVAFTVGVGLFAFTRMTKPLRPMVTAIDEVSQGNLNAQMPATPYRETEHIVTAFNRMTDHLKELFDEVYQSGLYLRDAEYKTLEAQINPHFIFNVLEVINMRAMAAGQEDICHMVTQLAALLRSNIAHRDRQKLTFGQELEYVDFYLQLQKQRFEDQLHYDIQLEDETLRGLYLPKLTIQPVVENSVVHGLENKRGGGTVTLRIWREDERVYIRVADDGVGFDPALVPLEEAAPAEGPHNHVALYNIHRRIQLLYGSGYGLIVESAPGEGSTVTITLPADTEPHTPGEPAPPASRHTPTLPERDPHAESTHR